MLTETEIDNDIRKHLVFRMSLFASITDRKGKHSFCKAFGLSLREYRILAVIAYMQPVSLSALVEECFLDKGQVSRNVRKLMQESLVRRKGGGIERGGKLELTATGTKLYRKALAHGDDLNELIAECLTDEERRVMSVALDKLLISARSILNDVG